jgi:thiamine-monophosphate kinase
MNEFELIARLTPHLNRTAAVVRGAGDDCAVLDLGLPERFVLFKTDAVVEGIHFTADTEPERVGHKALGRCLSDIAAMAGTPTAAVITLGLRRDFDPEYVERIYGGINHLARRYDVAICGGETIASPERHFLSVALIGTVAAGEFPTRAGAQPGDALFVTGRLGGSMAGKHLDFEPRLNEARWLASHFAIHAMMDLSDGLAGDLRHLLRASQVGAELLSSSIPISREAKLRARGGSGVKPPLLAALTDGEDFELLFAVSSRDAVKVLDAWRVAFSELPLTCIGKITSGSGITLRDKDGARPLNVHGYTHFT